jgi:hypothetical protein
MGKADLCRRLLLISLLVFGCGSPIPSPAVEAPRLAAFPPAPVERAIETRMRMMLEPLTVHARSQVTVDAEAAVEAALNHRGFGYVDAGGEKLVVWTRVGFVYLALYTPPSMPHDAEGEPIPAYLVQVWAPPIAGFPGTNTALVIVDAAQAKVLSGFGPCAGPLCGIP